MAQTLLFLLVFVFAPTHGLLANRRRAHKALEDRHDGIIYWSHQFTFMSQPHC